MLCSVINFCGFYNSVFDDDYLFDNEKFEMNSNLNNLVDGDIAIDISFTDRNEYLSSVGNKYLVNYFDSINDILFEYDLSLDYEFEGISSPKYYNYSTDDLIFELLTNYDDLSKIKDIVMNDLKPLTTELLIKNCSSYDGFISYYSNNIDNWINKDIKNYDSFEISFLLYVLFKEFVLNTDFDIETETYYNLDIYSFDLDYTIDNYTTSEFDINLFDYLKQNDLKFDDII